MRCENCGGYSPRMDNYCRRCGAELRNLRLPVKRTPVEPTVWRRAAPVLARGVALVALGVAAELALNTIARGAMRLPAVRGGAKARPLPAKRKDSLPEGTYVSETVILRRLIFRR